MGSKIPQIYTENSKPYQVGLAEILVEFVEVVHGEADAEHVDEDPQHVQHIVPEWSLH